MIAKINSYQSRLKRRNFMVFEEPAKIKLAKDETNEPTVESRGW